MGFKFGITYYAIVCPNGHTMAPYKADHNGLYERAKPAQAYLDVQIKIATQYSIGKTQNNKDWAIRLEALKLYKVVPIHVMLGEALPKNLAIGDANV